MAQRAEMKKKKFSKFYFLLFILLIFLDQIVKYFMTNKKYTIVRNFFYLIFKKNYGAAFGVLAGHRLFLVSAGIIITIALFFLLFKIKNKLPVIFLLAGTIGNLIDRLIFGYVRDFINIWFLSSFNFADVFCVIGGILLIIDIFKNEI